MLLEVITDSTQQRLARRYHPAGKDYTLRLRGVQHINTDNRKRFGRLVGYLFCQLVAGRQVLVKILAGYLPVFVENFLQTRFGARLTEA